MEGNSTNNYDMFTWKILWEATHTLYTENIETILKILELNIIYIFEEINIMTIQCPMSIILHKRRIEYKKTLPIDTQPS